MASALPMSVLSAAAGSMRMARRAGITQAISPTTSRSARTASQVIGIGRLDAKELIAHESHRGERAGETEHGPDRHEARPAHDDQAQDRRRASRPARDGDRLRPSAAWSSTRSPRTVRPTPAAARFRSGARQTWPSSAASSSIDRIHRRAGAAASGRAGDRDRGRLCRTAGSIASGSPAVRTCSVTPDS